MLSSKVKFRSALLLKHLHVAEQSQHLAKIDHSLLSDLQSTILQPPIADSFSPRRIANIYFEKNDLLRLDSETALLNDICINGIARFLCEIYREHPGFCTSALNCALFSTFDLARVQFKASDLDLWRNIANVQFWKCSTWIIPIHRRRDEHWVLAVVDWRLTHIFLYDSLGGTGAWSKNVEVCC